MILVTIEFEYWFTHYIVVHTQVVFDFGPKTVKFELILINRIIQEEINQYIYKFKPILIK